MKTMIETERKFLVDPNKIKLSKLKPTKIRQGYIGNLRIRTEQYNEYIFGILNIKTPTNNVESRIEHELEIDADFASLMLSECVNEMEIIEKDRYEIKAKNSDDKDIGYWEIDVYQKLNKGLFVAEIELENKDNEFILPEWIIKEITGEISFTNKFLSKNPYCLWDIQSIFPRS